MGLESLLARLEGRFVSPVSPEKWPVIQETRLQNNAVSPVSPVSPKRSGNKPESGFDVDTPASAVPPSWAVVPPTPADPLWGRVAITEPGGRTVEVDTPSGWTLPQWRTYAERYHGPRCAVTPIEGLPKPSDTSAPLDLDESLRGACEGLEGITVGGMGHWTRANTEDCLFAVRGKPKRVNADVSQFIEAPRGRHSAKPDEVRDRLVRLMGDVPRLEMFAREAIPGWDVWGNEVESTVELESTR